jgi:hypothetical protein
VRSLGPKLAQAIRRIALAAAVATGVGCLAPTLPVPPPSTPEVSAPDTTGVVTVQGTKGSAHANATVTVWNETYAESPACAADPACAPGVVRIVNPDGSWVVKVKAQSKDLLYVWQTIGNEQSDQSEVHVP